MFRALDFVSCLRYRGGIFAPLEYVVQTLKGKLAMYADANVIKEMKIAVKAYGCEFDNYLTCRTDQELNTQLQKHRREHNDHWNTEWACQTDLPFPITHDDAVYDRYAKDFTLRVHDSLMRFRIPLPESCTVYHGLVGLRKDFESPWRYMSTTVSLHWAINFAVNDDLLDPIDDKSDFPVVLELFLPAGTMVFSTDVCYCVQEENEITLAYPGEINVLVDYSKKEKTSETFTVPRFSYKHGNLVKTEIKETRDYYKIPAQLAPC